MNITSIVRTYLYKQYSKFNRWKLHRIYGMDIGENVKISKRAVLDYSRNPQGIHIGDNTFVTGNCIVLAHDQVRNLITNTYVGHNCFLGGGTIVMPGVKIGNHVICGAGSVVTKDVPDHCIVVGNPARIIKTGISLNDAGQIIN